MGRTTAWLVTLLATSMVCGCVGDPPPAKADGGDVTDGGVDSPVDVVLTVTRSGNGVGTVTSKPAGIDCGVTCSASYAPGTSVVLNVAPSVGSTFTGWSGGACSGAGDCTVTMTAAATVTATFTLDKVDLTVTKIGTGTVTSTPAAIDCGSTCVGSFDYGANVTLDAKPVPNATKFLGWSGGACTGLGPCSVNNLTAPATVTATFRTLATWDTGWSPAGVTFTGDNLAVSGNSAGTKVVRGTLGMTSGKTYWEIAATGGDGTTDAGGLGILDSAAPNNQYIGYTQSGLSFGYGACCYNLFYRTWAGVTVNGTPPVGSAVNAGIVYMFALDMTAGRFWAGQNGTWYNGGDPAGDANPVATGITGTVYPGVVLYDSSIDSFLANFGGAAFNYPAPAGFQPGIY